MTTSVAVCTYNGARYLSLQLQSIIEQTIVVDEIVICDDGSNDGTDTIVQFFKSSYPQIRVKFLKNPSNLGFLRNFEQALSICSGDIIFLSDQDDIWMPEKVQTFCDYFENHPNIDFVFSDAELINSNGIKSFSKTLFDVVGLDKENKCLFKKGYALEVLSTSGRVAGCTSAIRSSFLPYVLPFPHTHIRSIHDEIIAIIAATYGKIGFIDKPLIQYRQHLGQTIGISLLFKFPPNNWALAKKFRTWNKEIIDRNNSSALKRFEFIEKRFWSLRHRWSAIKVLKMFLSREYQSVYKHPSFVFLMDIKAIAIRMLKKEDKR